MRALTFIAPSNYLRYLLLSVFVFTCTRLCYSPIDTFSSTISTRLSDNAFPPSLLSRDLRPQVGVFLIVKTIPSDTVRRSAMRSTWLSQVSGTPSLAFRFFSEEPAPGAEADALHAEARLHRDIVTIPALLQRSHRKIGPKMLRSFQWVVENFNVTHAAIVDDDTYVNVGRLAQDWPTWETRRSYVGFHMMGQPVIKVKKGKVRVGKYGETWDFPTNIWPRYASGPFYALSADLLEPFINPPLELREMSSNDAMTGAVLLPYKVDYVHKEGFRMWGMREGQPCLNSTDLYAIHMSTRHQSNKTEEETWAAKVRSVHQDVLDGRCIEPFRL